MIKLKQTNTKLEKYRSKSYIHHIESQLSATLIDHYIYYLGVDNNNKKSFYIYSLGFGVLLLGLVQTLTISIDLDLFTDE